MKTIIQTLKATSLFLLVPLVANAQYELEFDSFLQDSLVYNGGIHGLAVDSKDQVWVQPWAQTETMTDADGNEIDVHPIYVYEDGNGEQADYSPIKVLSYNDEHDTLSAGGRNRGLATDHEGNILASLGSVLYRIDAETGDVLNKRDFEEAALASASSTEDGETLVGFVDGGLPLVLIDENFEDIQFAVQQSEGSRSVEISPDGKYIYDFQFDEQNMYAYHSEDGVEGEYGDTQLIIEGVYMESSVIHPVTGDLWFSTNPPLVGQDNEAFDPVSWYAIDIESVVEDGVDAEDAIVESEDWQYWDGEEDLRPRGVAFSQDGANAYFGMYNNSVIHAYEDYEVTSVDDPTEVAEEIALSQNYPNPFNPTTSIEFTIENSGHTSLTVYNVLGQEVATLVNESLSSGTHEVTFDGSDLSSGIYLYVLESAGQQITKEMTLIK